MLDDVGTPPPKKKKRNVLFSNDFFFFLLYNKYPKHIFDMHRFVNHPSMICDIKALRIVERLTSSAAKRLNCTCA